MVSRTLIAFVSALLPAFAAANVRWQATVTPPVRGLPPVTVVMGEPGLYVPTLGSRIELSVVGSPVSFDGYIGYHFTFEGRGARLTSDLPVISPVSLRRGGGWSLATRTPIERPLFRGNAIVVEWRNRKGGLLAQETAGIPPWTSPRPLRITREGEPQESGLLLGQPPVVVAVSSLHSDAQWYQGVSDVVVAVDVWLDLPPAVREAIFASAVSVVFFGVPRDGQTMTAIDRALIPVEFTHTPSHTAVPWPYRTETPEIASPWSWRARPETRVAGSAPSPFLVSSALATYAADESALALPLPSMLLQTFGNGARRTFSNGGRPAFGDILREFRPLIACVVIVILSIGLWMFGRRTPRPVLLAVAILLSTVVVMARNWLRPASGTMEWEEVSPLTPEVVSRLQSFYDFAQTPLTERRLPPDEARTSVTAHGNEVQDAEIRTSATAPGFGAPLRRVRPSDSMSRWLVRNELGVPPRVRIRRVNGTSLEIDYESATPVHFVAAHWKCGDGFCRGIERLKGGTSGHATIREGSEVWPVLFWFAILNPLEAEPQFPDAEVRVALIERKARGVRITDWVRRTEDKRRFSIQAPLREENERGRLRAAFALPPGLPATTYRFAMSLSGSLPARSMTVTGEGGSMVLDVEGRLPLIGNHRYTAGEDTLHRIAPNGGILQVEIEAGDLSSDRSGRWAPRSLWLSVWEKRK